MRSLCTILGCWVAVVCGAPQLHGQDPDDGMDEASMPPMADQDMWSVALGGGWQASGMAQFFPIVTSGAPSVEDSPLHGTHWYLTQPVLMIGLEGPGQRIVLRTTLDFEAITLRDGEVNFGAWGEGFIDKRHPHTLLHELMLSLNSWGLRGGNLSVSAGKGFVPYGTDDPMSRPGLKFPTNHHLSQVLERWTVNGAYLRGGWGFEVAVFGGTETEGPYDLSNIESFGDSWATRLSKRWGSGSGPFAEWEVSASQAWVVETHHDALEKTRLWNGAVRHLSGPDSGLQEALIEVSLSRKRDHNNFFSILGELGFDRLGHQPYARVEYSSRPEYAREREDRSLGFFRYDDASDPVGSTRWLTSTVAYAYEMTGYPLSLRPFLEFQHFKVWEHEGQANPVTLFGSDSFWAITLGARIFLGGSPMRMGAYGVLGAMTGMSRMGTMAP